MTYATYGHSSTDSWGVYDPECIVIYDRGWPGCVCWRSIYALPSLLFYIVSPVLSPLTQARHQES